jgi:hypothetical protein
MISLLAFAQWDGDFPGDGTFPWLGDSITVINDSTFVVGGDTIVFSENDWDNDDWDDDDWDENDNPWGGNGNDNPWDNDDWDDEWDGDFPFGDSIVVINDSTIVINGDIITLPGGNGSFPGDGEWPWDDSTDVECPWDDGFPGDSEGEEFDDEVFEEMTDIIAGFDMAADDLVLIIEQTAAILSIIDESGLEFTPTEVDGYLVFGPFSMEDLYTIIIENLEGYEIGWGLFRPMGAQIIGEGVITIEGSLNEMFTVSSMLSLIETAATLEVYKTTYYNVLGKEVKDPNNGVVIKVMQTNKGEVSTKIYIAK